MNCINNFFDKKNVFYILKYLSVAVLTVLVIELLKYLFDINEPQSSKLKESFFSNIIWSTISIVLISPILEEFAFRLSIKKNKYYATSILLCILFLMSSSLIYVKITCSLFIGAIILYQYSSRSNIYLLKNITVVLSVLTFVLVHFDNYEVEQLKILNFFSIVTLFIPQVVVCFILTKVRSETSLLNSIVIHSLYNLLILTFGLFFNY